MLILRPVHKHYPERARWGLQEQAIQRLADDFGNPNCVSISGARVDEVRTQLEGGYGAA